MAFIRLRCFTLVATLELTWVYAWGAGLRTHALHVEISTTGTIHRAIAVLQALLEPLGATRVERRDVGSSPVRLHVVWPAKELNLARPG